MQLTSILAALPLRRANDARTDAISGGPDVLADVLDTSRSWGIDTTFATRLMKLTSDASYGFRPGSKP